MSQRAVEQVLGKLLTDEEFRRRFFEDPHCACFRSGFELSPVELEAVMRTPRTPLAALSRRLDDRILRLCLPATPDPEERPH
jgi:hypothetical protein